MPLPRPLLTVLFAVVALMPPLRAQDRPGDALLLRMAQVNASREEGLRDAANQPSCTACTAIVRQLDGLAETHQLFQQDVHRAFSAFAEGPDSLLMGRLDMAGLQLPLQDFLGALERLVPGVSAGQADPVYVPGLYRRADLNQLRLEQEGIAMLAYREALAVLAGKLEEAAPVPVLIAPAELNLLYTGIDNRVRVYVGGALPESVVLEGPGARATDEPGYWTVNPTDPGPVTLRVTGRSPSGKSVQGTASFTARRVPEPSVYVAGRTDGILIKQNLTAQTGISARNDDFFLDAGFTIKGFELVYTPEYGSPVSAKTPGNKFSAEMMQILNRTKPGDRLIFRVAVAWPDGSIKTLSPVFYVR